MNFAELINQNISKKWGIAIIGIVALVQVSAPSWQIMVVTATAIMAQGYLDLKKQKGEQDVPKNSD